MQHSKQLIWILLLPLLAACSREPSEQDLQQVYTQSLEKTNALTTQLGGKNMRIELKSFKKLNCQKTDVAKQYLCNIEANLDLPIMGNQTQQGELKVQKTQSDWVIIQD
jgi:hypothetical protein